MTDLSSLIECLEKATGPGRELDARIHACLFPDTKYMSYGGDVRSGEPAKYERLGDFDFDKWAGETQSVDWDALAHMFGASSSYSASIDAAVALAERVLTGATISDPAEVVREAIRGLSSEHRWHINLYKTGQLSGLARHIVLATLRALQSKGPEA